MKISVIIPFYNVEKYIQRCVISLMEQTLKDVEFIFVDDASPDHSRQVLEKTLSNYPQRSGQVRILSHYQNKGLPAARNTGMAVASGEYIYHCDSDDFMERDMLESLYNAAIDNEADFIWSDWFLSYEQKERYMKQPSFDRTEDAVKSLLSGGMKYNVWNKLIKRTLYTENDVRFPAGYAMGEDMTIIRLAACAKSMVYVPRAFYHYVRTNDEAMTQSYSERHYKDIRYNVELTLDFLRYRPLLSIEKEVEFFKLNVKYPFLITDNWASYRRWNEWYPEANRFISENPAFSMRCRWLQVWAVHKWYVLLWIYYKVVYCLVYKFIYG